MLEEIGREVERSAFQLYQTFGRSRYLTDRVNNIREFVVQFLVGSATGNPMAAVGVSAATALGKTGLSAVGNRELLSQRAFKQHVEALRQSIKQAK